jgi:hypothetical protein
MRPSPAYRLALSRYIRTKLRTHVSSFTRQTTYASYSGVSEFRSEPGDWLSWPRNLLRSSAVPLPKMVPKITPHPLSFFKIPNLFGVFTLWRWSQYVPPQGWYLSVCLLRGFGIPEDHKRNVLTYFFFPQPPTKRLRKRVVHELCVEMDIFISRSRSLRKESDKWGLEQLTYRLGAGRVPNWAATCSRLVTWSNLFYSLGNVDFSCEYDAALLMFLLFFVIWIIVYYLYWYYT